MPTNPSEGGAARDVNRAEAGPTASTDTRTAEAESTFGTKSSTVGRDGDRVGERAADVDRKSPALPSHRPRARASATTSS
jgi:hypothetical protein